MNCFSEEQIVGVALGLSENSDEMKQLTTHLKECVACQAKLTAHRRAIEQLSAAHLELDRTHATSRARLMAKLSNEEVSARTSDLRSRLTFRFGGLTTRQRITVVGLTSAAVAAIALISVALNASHSLSAMERMCKVLNQVKSYGFKNTEHVTIQKKGMTAPGIVNLSDITYWQAPGSLREELRIVLSGNVPRGYHSGQMDCDIVSISLTDKPGILIDHLTKTFMQESKMRPEDTGSGSLTYPNHIIRTIREESGKIARDLGTRNIQGKLAHGYAMLYKNDTDPIDVWLDPQTDLPVEIGFTAKDETTTEVVRYTDFRWNIDLDPKLFDTTPPVDYTDITPPDDVATLAAISSALRWYADLSGGHYPQIDTDKVNEKFDADAIYVEMLKMAGFSGPLQPQWSHDSKYRELQQTKVGLDWIAKITRAEGTTRYDGRHVTPKDNDKILLWWLPGALNGATDGYRIFYGDLRTKVLSKAEAEKAIPPQPKLWDQAPADEGKPADQH
jgi:hypothetical protein